MAPSLRSNSNAAALTGFAVGSAVTLLGVWLSSSRSSSASSKDNAATKASGSRSSAVTLPPEIREEQLSRHTLYFGEDGMENLKNASILVVGVGGVGSHIVHMVSPYTFCVLRAILDFFLTDCLNCAIYHFLHSSDVLE